MKLPNGRRALVEERKLREYILNPLHPVGKHHALLFGRLLGIYPGNAEVLKRALERAALHEEVLGVTTTPHGQKFEVGFEFSGPAGTKRVMSVWIIDEGRDRPRLVTCYVE